MQRAGLTPYTVSRPPRRAEGWLEPTYTGLHYSTDTTLRSGHEHERGEKAFWQLSQMLHLDKRIDPRLTLLTLREGSQTLHFVTAPVHRYCMLRCNTSLLHSPAFPHLAHPLTRLPPPH